MLELSLSSATPDVMLEFPFIIDFADAAAGPDLVLELPSLSASQELQQPDSSRHSPPPLPALK